jgi:hypothetical protein
MTLTITCYANRGTMFTYVRGSLANDLRCAINLLGDGDA